MGDWPVGLSTGCFYRRPIFDCLEAVQRAGFSILEICSSPHHLDYHDHTACRRAAAQIRDLYLEPYSFHAPFAAEIDITALDAAERAHALAEISKAAEAAAILGVRYFVIHPGPEKTGLPTGERLERMANAATVLNEVAALCRRLGLWLVLENMLPHLFSGHVRDLLWLLGALDTTEVGLCLDTGHAYLSGDLHTVAQKLAGHLWMLHASDTRGRFDDHLPPGQGVVPWPALVSQLAATRFCGALILEIAAEGSVEDILQGAQEARRYLRRLVMPEPWIPKGRIPEPGQADTRDER